MFKVFPYNNDYEFSLTGLYRFKGVEISSSLDNISIMLYGCNGCYSRVWLGLVAHYELDLPLSELVNVEFVRNSSRVLNLKCGYLQTFSKPVTVWGAFRVIPGFTRFAINEDGIVKSIKSNRVLKQSINFYGYPYVNVYDADKGRWRSVALHILLARAFIHNHDPGTLSFVNHKNGIKTDYRLCNLEWATSNHNNTHARDTGLRADNVECKLKDLETGSISFFSSISSALLSIGLLKYTQPFKIVNGVTVPRLLKNRYELKFKDDHSDWHYNGKCLSDRNLNRLSGPYQAKNMNTDEIIEGLTIPELSKKTGVSVYTIETLFRQEKVKSSNGFIFRQKSGEAWPKNPTELQFYHKRSFKLTNTNTNEVENFDSLRKAKLFLGIDKKTFKHRLDNKKPYGDWEIEEIL
jgi:hypothetical protein